MNYKVEQAWQPKIHLDCGRREVKLDLCLSQSTSGSTFGCIAHFSMGSGSMDSIHGMYNNS